MTTELIGTNQAYNNTLSQAITIPHQHYARTSDPRYRTSPSSATSIHPPISYPQQQQPSTIKRKHSDLFQPNQQPDHSAKRFRESTHEPLDLMAPDKPLHLVASAKEPLDLMAPDRQLDLLAPENNAESGNAAKHWSDEEKDKLFKWLMGKENEEHWNSLRSAKNNCLRECANEVFAGRKTYQALKGCYERNFNIFKQIYAFEQYNAQHHSKNTPLEQLPESERMKEYDKRLVGAKKADYDVGNITPRNIDHWKRMGWYTLFFDRWESDPQARPRSYYATMVPVRMDDSAHGNGWHPGNDSSQRHSDPRELSSSGNGTNSNGSRQSSGQSACVATSAEGTHVPGKSAYRYHSEKRDPMAAFSSRPFDSLPESPMTSATPQSRQTRPSESPTLAPTSATTSTLSTASSSTAVGAGGGSGDQTAVNVTITQNMLGALIQCIQLQTQIQKEKLEILRRREDREEREAAAKSKSDAANLDMQKEMEASRQRDQERRHLTDQAIQLLGNPNIDALTKKSASEHLRKMFINTE